MVSLGWRIAKSNDSPAPIPDISSSEVDGVSITSVHFTLSVNVHFWLIKTLTFLKFIPIIPSGTLFTVFGRINDMVY
jgi:hypothetical protein